MRTIARSDEITELLLRPQRVERRLTSNVGEESVERSEVVVGIRSDYFREEAWKTLAI